MLEVRNLECVRNGLSLFKPIHFSLERGGVMQFHGANGSGKTSLLRMLCGLAAATGDILWCGENIRALRGEYHRELTYLSHESMIKDELTAIENVRISSKLAGASIDAKKTLGALNRVGLSGHEHLPAKFLSQGQRRRVPLAGLLLCGKRLWILDEPLTALDLGGAQLLQTLLHEHLQDAGMVVLTSHQEIKVMATSSQSLLLA